MTSIRSESGRSAVSSQVTGIAADGDSPGEFGANEWLVDEMYELYLQDKNLVDKSWWPVLENYHSTITATPDASAQAQPDTDVAAAAAPGALAPELATPAPVTQAPATPAPAIPKIFV